MGIIMSPDDIFAAHMWPWPDPLIKRDATGRILFLNIAFLNIYGGRVEDWQGNVIAGWPTPQAGPGSSRFETRIPSAEGELIYDWIECTMADGHALAIARDVTSFVAPTPPPPAEAPLPQMDMAPPLTPPPLDVQPQAEPVSGNFPANSSFTDSIISNALGTPELAPQHAPQASTHAHPETQTIIDTPAPITTQTDLAPASSVPTPLDSMLDKNTSDFVQPAQTQFAPPAAIDVAAPHMEQVQDTAPNAPASEPVSTPENMTPEMPHIEPQNIPTPPENAGNEPAAIPENTPERDFERRALPIENDDAVLGNNWRDAVIAKAVGATENETDAGNAHTETNVNTSVSATPEPNGAPSAHRILLAEDNAINALLTRTLLEAEGCVVDVVEDGLLAVEAVKNAAYDMIFMDMRMPNMDGLEATRKIRALDHRSKSLPIVALTANAFDDDRNACFDSGMNDFMTKPVSAEELTEMVATWMKSREDRLAS